MGTIKFYNGGQSVTECMLFSLTDMFNVKSNYTLSVYPSNTYTDSNLVTSTNKMCPYLKFNNNTEYTYNAYLTRFGTAKMSSNYRGIMFGSTDTTHDKTLSTFHNSVANIDYLSEATYNGVKTMVLSMTNLSSENSVTVCSIQRSNTFTFTTSAGDTNTSPYYYLDWAYYFDQDEYITLEPSETKTVVINFTLSDITA